MDEIVESLLPTLLAPVSRAVDNNLESSPLYLNVHSTTLRHSIKNAKMKDYEDASSATNLRRRQTYKEESSSSSSMSSLSRRLLNSGALNVLNDGAQTDLSSSGNSGNSNSISGAYLNNFVDDGNSRSSDSSRSDSSDSSSVAGYLFSDSSPASLSSSLLAPNYSDNLINDSVTMIMGDGYNVTDMSDFTNSSSSSPSCDEFHPHDLPFPLLFFIGVALFVIIFASVCGNLLVIFAVYKNLRLRSKTNVSIA